MIDTFEARMKPVGAAEKNSEEAFVVITENRHLYWRNCQSLWDRNMPNVIEELFQSNEILPNEVYSIFKFGQLHNLPLSWPKMKKLFHIEIIIGWRGFCN